MVRSLYPWSLYALHHNTYISPFCMHTMVVCRYLQCKEVSCHASLFGTGFHLCCWKCVLSMLKSQHTDSGSANLEYQLCSADTTIAYAAACQLRSWLHISTCPCAKPNIWDCPVHAGTYRILYIAVWSPYGSSHLRSYVSNCTESCYVKGKNTSCA